MACPEVATSEVADLRHGPSSCGGHDAVNHRAQRAMDRGGTSWRQSDQLDEAVVAAVVTTGVMQVPVDQVVDVVTVGNGLVTAAGTVLVIGIVAAAHVARGTVVGVRLVDLDAALVHVIAVRPVQVAIVQVADVVAVLDRSVAALGAVIVVVFVAGHGALFGRISVRG